MKFTEEQKNAIFYQDGPMRVIACPGSGKTTTIVGKVATITEEMENVRILI